MFVVLHTYIGTWCMAVIIIIIIIMFQRTLSSLGSVLITLALRFCR